MIKYRAISHTWQKLRGLLTKGYKKKYYAMVVLSLASALLEVVGGVYLTSYDTLYSEARIYPR